VRGPVEATYGWGPFTPWLYLAALLWLSRISGLSLLGIRLMGFCAEALSLILMFLLMHKLAGAKNVLNLILVFLFMFSPLTILPFRVKPIEPTVWLLIVSAIALILLSNHTPMRVFGFVLLPLVFWLHCLAALIPLCVFLAMLILNSVTRKYICETAGLAISGVLVVCLSAVFALMAGKFSLAPAAEGAKLALEISWKASPLKAASIIVFSATTGFILLEIAKHWSARRKDLFLALLSGIVPLPILAGLKVSRVQDFISIPGFLLLYIYFSSIPRKLWYKGLILALFSIGITLLWLKATPWKYARDNLSYIRGLTALVKRNSEAIQVADTILIGTKGIGSVFLMLPPEKMLGVGRYRGQQLGSRQLAFVSDLDYSPSLRLVDSLVLDRPYSYYGSYPIRKIYLASGAE